MSRRLVKDNIFLKNLIINNSKIRINKYLAYSGKGSRRFFDRMIKEGRVTVNGIVLSSPAIRVDPIKDRVEFDGELINFKIRRKVIILYKPRGVLVTNTDPEGRITIYDILSKKIITSGLRYAGRLDRDSEGLILLSNDGELIQRLTHPKYGVEKTYLVRLNRRLKYIEIDKLLKNGVIYNGERIFLDSIKPVRITSKYYFIKPNEKKNNFYKVIIHEGKKHHIRNFFSAINIRIRRLIRIKMGEYSILKTRLKIGEFEDIQ